MSTDLTQFALPLDESNITQSLVLSPSPPSTSYTTPGIQEENYDFTSDAIRNGVETYRGISGSYTSLSQRSSTDPYRVDIRAVTPTQTPIENPLHEYASYTYNLSLHMLEIDEYNKIINANFENKNPAPYVPKNVLISSAGRWNQNDFARNRHFIEDFYFDNFKMETLITPSMRNRNTNVIECSFTIIEPNGFTLINRMIRAANEINKNHVRAPGSYIQLPYVLQIDFFGYTEDENSKPEKIKDLTKIIPIKIVHVETSVKQSGAEYRFDAVPFHHSAYSQINNALPFNTKIQADTVAAAFSTGSDTTSGIISIANLIEQTNSTEREISQLRKNQDALNENLFESQSTLNRLDDIDTRLSTSTTKLKELKNTTLDVKSVCDAFNNYYQTLKDRGDIKQAPIYIVEFDEEIAKAKLFAGPQPVDVSSASTSPDSETTTAQKAGGASKGNSLTFKAGAINIPAGTTIDKLIDFIVRHSDYVLDQLYLQGLNDLTVELKEETRSGSSVETIVNKLSKPLKWFKIVPSIKIGQWDDSQGRYVPEVIMFRVKTFTISSKYSFAPRGRVPGYVKEYNYIFTGRNRDIIDWNINFNTLYLIAVTAGLNKSIQGSTGSGLNSAGQAANPEFKNTSTSLPILGDSVATPGVTLTAGNQNVNLTGGNTQKAIASGDLQNSLFLDSRNDMIELDLTIIGDPLFIKQDDIFYNRPGVGENATLTPNKSLYMDSGELYIFVNFLSPVDYDEEKGLAEIKANEILGYEKEVIGAKNLGYSNFSGVYKLISVDSSFTRGKFEQTLRMAKVLFDQLGIENNTLRQEQVTQLAKSIQLAKTRADRFTSSASGAADFLSDVNATNALLLNNFGLNNALLPQGLNILSPIAGRITGAVQQIGGAIESTISTLRGTPFVAPPTPPTITDAGFSTFQNPGE